MFSRLRRDAGIVTGTPWPTRLQLIEINREVAIREITRHILEERRASLNRAAFFAPRAMVASPFPE